MASLNLRRDFKSYVPGIIRSCGRFNAAARLRVNCRRRCGTRARFILNCRHARFSIWLNPLQLPPTHAFLFQIAREFIGLLLFFSSFSRVYLYSPPDFMLLLIQTELLGRIASIQKSKKISPLIMECWKSQFKNVLHISNVSTFYEFLIWKNNESLK